MADFLGNGWPSRDRYVLIRTLDESTPSTVQPVATLDEARQRLKTLNGNGDGHWHIFDLSENRRVE
jgi:hypothetical protein